MVNSDTILDEVLEVIKNRIDVLSEACHKNSSKESLPDSLVHTIPIILDFEDLSNYKTKENYKEVFIARFIQPCHWHAHLCIFCS
jgi:hypothetical protein